MLGYIPGCKVTLPSFCFYLPRRKTTGFTQAQLGFSGCHAVSSMGGGKTLSPLLPSILGALENGSDASY
jgi:hypothetical protein